jgi:hypothetical protein
MEFTLYARVSGRSIRQNHEVLITISYEISASALELEAMCHVTFKTISQRMFHGFVYLPGIIRMISFVWGRHLQQSNAYSALVRLGKFNPLKPSGYYKTYCLQNYENSAPCPQCIYVFRKVTTMKSN